MIVIPFFAILNAYWGGGEHKKTLIGKWLCLPAAFIAVYAVSHDWKLSLAWAVYFMAWRLPSLSKEGFKVFKRETWREGAEFFIWRAAWLALPLLATYLGLRYFGFVIPEMLLMAWFPFIVAAIYSGVGYFYPITKDEHNVRIRWVECACGLVLGVLIAASLYLTAA